MNLADFVRTLPKNWATAPIYAKGFKLPGEKGGLACGKSPLGRAHRENLSPHASARYIEQHPDTYQAVGVFTGPRSDGLVILDVDANLPTLKRNGERVSRVLLLLFHRRRRLLSTCSVCPRRSGARSLESAL